MGFHEFGVGFEERVLHIMQQRIENGLARQYLRTGAGERRETSDRIVRSACTHGVGQHGDRKFSGERIHRGPVDAHRRFEAAQHQMFDAAVAHESFANAIVGEPALNVSTAASVNADT